MPLSPIVAVLITVVLYTWDPKLAVAALAGVCGWLLSRGRRQDEMLERQREHEEQQDRRLADLGRKLQALEEAGKAVPPASPMVQVVEEPVTPVAASHTPPPPEDSAPIPPPLPPSAAPERTPPSPSAPSAEPAAHENAHSLPGPLQWLLQGNPVAKIGVLLLFFGLAYLFKFAADHDMLPIELRLGGAVLLALALLGIGWKLREKQPLYGLLLQGAASGSLYLVIFAAYRLYALLPHALAFGLMLAVCAASVALAVLQQAKGLAMAASLGGFLAPILLSSGSSNPIGLFSYYLLLSGGILAVSLFQSWRSLNLIGFFFTFGIGSLWGLERYTPQQYPECQFFLIAFLLVYGVIALLFAFRQPAQLRGFVDGTLVFGSPLIGFGLQYGLTRHWEFGPAFSALGFAAFYLPLAAWLLRTRPEHGRLLAQAFLALGLAFVTLAIPLGLDANWTSVAWALEGAGLLWVGSAQQQRRMLWSGCALQAAAAVAWIMFLLDHPTTLSGGGSGVMLSLSWLAGGYALSRAGKTFPENDPLSRLLLGGGLLWWMVTLPWLLYRGDFAQDLHILMYLLAMAGSAALWHLASRRLAWTDLGYGAWLLWPAMLVSCDLPGHQLQGWTWPGWIVAMALAFWLLRQREQQTRQPLLLALHTGLAWLLAGLLITETLWRIETAVPEAQEWTTLALLALPAALTALLVAGRRRGLWPFAPQALAWLGLGALPLLVLLVRGLILDNRFDGRLDELGIYIPLLNPLELSAGLGLLALLLWLREARGLWPDLSPPRPALIAVVAVLAFWWGNGMLLRLLAQIGGLPWTVDALWLSRLVQTSVALAWTVCALLLMWKAARQGWRLVWISGAALLAVVVAKLFLVDSASGGGLARAVAFIGVALLLLLIGYVAPLPPRRIGGEDRV